MHPSGILPAVDGSYGDPKVSRELTGGEHVFGVHGSSLGEGASDVEMMMEARHPRLG
jgi:hypothetical protein